MKSKVFHSFLRALPHRVLVGSAPKLGRPKWRVDAHFFAGVLCFKRIAAKDKNVDIVEAVSY